MAFSPTDPNLTQNNHFCFGYGPNLAEFQPTETFYLQFGLLKREPLLPFAEAKLCAENIALQQRKIKLCLSGGLDGESAALAFLHAKVPFSVAILKFCQGWNDYDIQHAISFCMRTGLNYEIIDLDIMSFLENGDFVPWAEKYRTGSPELAAHCWFLHQIEGCPVLGGDVFRAQVVAGEMQVIIANDHDLCFFRYFTREQRPGIPSFHYYSSEFAWSFMAHVRPHPETYLHDPDDRSYAYYRTKEQRYERGGFPLWANPKRQSKFHGFEKIKNHFDQRMGSVNGYIDRFRKPVQFQSFMPLNKAILVAQNDIIANRIFAPALVREVSV